MTDSSPAVDEPTEAQRRESLQKVDEGIPDQAPDRAPDQAADQETHANPALEPD